MRVITAKTITEAMQKHAQWKVGLKLWLDVFDKASLRFESYAQIRELWLKTSTWNVDRVPCALLEVGSKKGPLDIYLFDIHKNKCRIITWFNPKSGTFYIKDVCSHTEYDKWWRKQTKSKRSKR
ncbi:type II toxin-antitoxin system HigB family toxin [Xenorhabdus sp. IM139775]|uniref:type II toxin-antitoxin system HigB family toxin n=1 Tax=Xenorhabdus sp. IM139775 TaxID=3025876 RepID=UPI002359D203|nr:type II toxin-antitoxin system HigB family toxin [Xenorhabdus sp. IM139775]MDC9593334.1 type II toxin-antitoxin system HigB family toxin [Xenorhabdus sp. IM139775]